MVGQVKVVGILMLVHGITVIIMGGILVFSGAMLIGIAPPPGPGGGPGFDPTVIAVIYGVWGGTVVALGVLHSVAGFRVMLYRNRILGLIALFSNVLVLLTCYCTLTALGMMVYGLIVMFQPDVTRAFEMVARGATPEEAIGRYTRRYYDARDDYDEMNQPRREWDEDPYERRDRDEEERRD